MKSLRPYSPARTVGVTLGLTGAGALCGGFAGAAGLALALLIEAPFGRAPLGIYLFAAGVGAPLGALLAPLASWLLLRRVPVGRSFLRLTLGTIVGGVAGWFTLAGHNPLVWPTAVAAAGFLSVAIALRLTHRRAPRTALGHLDLADAAGD